MNPACLGQRGFREAERQVSSQSVLSAAPSRIMSLVQKHRVPPYFVDQIHSNALSSAEDGFVIHVLKPSDPREYIHSNRA